MKLTTACLTTTQQHKNNINNNSDKNHSKRAKHSNKQQGVKQNVHLTTPTHKKLCLKSFQKHKKKKKTRVGGIMPVDVGRRSFLLKSCFHAENKTQASATGLKRKKPA